MDHELVNLILRSSVFFCGVGLPGTIIFIVVYKKHGLEYMKQQVVFLSVIWPSVLFLVIGVMAAAVGLGLWVLSEALRFD